MAKILLVDDEQDVRFVMSELLADLGHEVIEAASACIGLEKLELDHPDLVFLDLGMPDMSGTEALAQIRQADATRRMPVVLLTGVASETELRQARDLGIHGLIRKPWESADVERQVLSLTVAR